jgi:hypothetical protein
MNGIHDPNDKFEFNKLLLTSPTVVSGGNHFIKYSMNDMPLYIQPPKCKVKQGIIKTGKRAYCDLMFTNENENFIRWLENLENYSQKQIFINREKWFETALDEHDIENSFTSPLKIYKSGKYYIVRTNIPTALGKTNFKVYDENENIIDIETIKENENVATILEIQGIKCSARSFQIEIEMKQLLVLNKVDLFEKCILTKKSEIVKESLEKTEDENLIENKDIYITRSVENNTVVIETVENESHYDNNNNTSQQMNDDSNNINNISFEKYELDGEPEQKEEISKNLQHINLEKTELIEEVDLNLEKIEENEPVFLKKRNDVYYEMYREALRKAKLAKEMALSNYLEAKRIKNTYMLDELNDDSDFEDDNINLE